ncbi:sorting nexin-like protein [Cordyceps javanica]|uniref:Endosomal/vacuolar adapter protein YPT35 n=1 Tax=Cordyceps javanica TaxID=43265 RepID=A0A545V410_9HYPO|nr:sorting nexin-like protein [Cordyceps javanica]TQW07734.1 sorting nexin-like protein [Cordyceps javanica]
MEAALRHRRDGEDGEATTVQAQGPSAAGTAGCGGGDGGGNGNGIATPSTARLAGLQRVAVSGAGDETRSAMIEEEESSIHCGLPATMPPYWQNMPARQRAASTHSSDSDRAAGAILLLDHEADDDQGRNDACWARSVQIIDHTIVNGAATSIGAFVVWNVRVETLQGSYMDIRKRYSEFDTLRYRLMKSFPNFAAAVPSLPPKSVISKFRPKFLEKRRAGLQYFLK